MITLVALLCAQSALVASSSDDSKKRKHRAKSGKIEVSSLKLASIYNNLDASHRVDLINPKKKCPFIPARSVAQVNARIPFSSGFDPANFTIKKKDTDQEKNNKLSKASKMVSQSLRICKGDHSYIIKHYDKGFWIFRVKDSGALSRKDRKQLLSLKTGGDEQKINLLMAHPKIKKLNESRIAAFNVFFPGDQPKLQNAKTSGGSRRFSMSTIVKK